MIIGVNGQMNSEGQFYEMIRLTSVAATQATESEIDNIEIGQGKSLRDFPRYSDGFIKLNGRGNIVAFFKRYGLNMSQEGLRQYKVSDATITKSNSGGYELRINYMFSDRKEKPILESALNAILHVVSNVESNAQIKLKEN